jgi:outer membrane lipopolysaccharide assembly protein LptE/RlpB
MQDEDMARTLPALLLATLALAACDSKPPADTQEMTQMPTGLWVGSSEGVGDIDIQASGTLRLTRNGQEVLGTWKKVNDSTLSITLNGQTAETSFQRKDLSLTLTLPGDNQPSTFTQM